MQKLFFSFLATLLFFNIATSIAQDVVSDQLDNIKKQLLKQGYSQTHDVFYEYLDDSDYDFYSINLEAGVEYQIVAVCDEDCGDIDMCIFDSNANQLDCDKTDDDIPVLIFTATETGKHKVWVKMYECSIDPCKFGLVAYGK